MTRHSLQLKDDTGEGHTLEVADAKAAEGYRMLALELGFMRGYASGTRGYEYELETGEIWLNEDSARKLYEFLKGWVWGV